MISSRRIGSFKLSGTLINENPEAVKAVMAKVVVAGAEYKIEDDCVHYIALHDDFHIVPEGARPYQYKVYISADGGEYQVEFKC